MSLLLVDATLPGVSVRRMKLQGNWLGGTCAVTFDDVKVPAGELSIHHIVFLSLRSAEDAAIFILHAFAASW